MLHFQFILVDEKAVITVKLGSLFLDTQYFGKKEMSYKNCYSDRYTDNFQTKSWHLNMQSVSYKMLQFRKYPFIFDCLRAFS